MICFLCLLTDSKILVFCNTKYLQLVNFSRFFAYLCNMNPKLSSAWSWISRFMSPMTLVSLIVVAYIVFAGENTVFNSIEYNRTIDSLRSELEANRDTMLYYRDLNHRLSTDKHLMEQVVREQYGMKRADEDVYKFTNTPRSLEN